MIDTLRFFCGESDSKSNIDDDLLAMLGEASDEKKWLAASLNKTIRLQLDAPSEMRELSAMTAPEWLESSNAL